VLGDVQRQMAQSRGHEHLVAMVAEQAGSAGPDGALADIPENSGEHVQTDVIESVDQGLTADVDELCVELRRWTEQRRRVRADPQVREPEPPCLVPGGLHPGGDRAPNVWVVAVEHRVAGDVRFLRNLDGPCHRTVPHDRVADERRVSGDVARRRAVLEHEIEHSTLDGVLLATFR